MKTLLITLIFFACYGLQAQTSCRIDSTGHVSQIDGEAADKDVLTSTKTHFNTLSNLDMGNKYKYAVIDFVNFTILYTYGSGDDGYRSHLHTEEKAVLTAIKTEIQ